MRRVNPVVRLIGICLLMTFFATAQDTALKGKPELDPQSIIDDSNELIERIRQEINESGGDLNTQQVQWVFALSTGHYGKDPQGARAAREVAQYLVRELASPKDSVTVRAWEMTLWDHLSSDNRRKILDDPADLEPQALGRLWPTTPVKDSKGGHDTERVIVDLVAELGKSQDAILILITNTAASVAAKGTKLIGTNASPYLKILEDWRRVEGDKDGATQRVKYLVVAAGKSTTSRLEVVVVLPKIFNAPNFPDGGTRDSLRMGSVPVQEGQAEKPPLAEEAAVSEETSEVAFEDNKPSGFPIFFVALLLIGGIAFVVLRLRGGGFSLAGTKYLMSVEDYRFSLSEFSTGQTICTLVGGGYQGDVLGEKVVIKKAPSVEIARIVREKRGIKIDDGDLRFNALDNQGVISNNLEVGEDMEHEIGFEGEVGGRNYEVSVSLRFAKEV